MPQILKDDVRERILSAALEVFAERGFTGATISQIAERAGLGAASLYRYYGSKSELFDAVITPELAERFESLLERRVRALSELVLTGASQSDQHSEEILRFWLQNRLAVVVLLDRAEGTAYSHFGERFVERLVSTTISQLRGANPGLKVNATARFVLTRIFENTRRMLAAILAEHDDERTLREAIAAFWSYQLPGLAGFTAWLSAPKR